MVTILISFTFIGEALSRGEALISLWIPKDVMLIGGWHLFEAQRLLEEIWDMWKKCKLY